MKGIEKGQKDWRTPLFEGRLVQLGFIKPDEDARIESQWTHDAEFQRMLNTDLVRPLSQTKIKQKYTEIERKMDESGKLFYFAIRRLQENAENKTSSENQLLGFAVLDDIEWSQGTGQVTIAIGDPRNRRSGYGKDALKLLLRYAFGELNLFRLSAIIPGYNQAALRLFEKSGFKVEARQREALHREGRHWDLIRLGLLRPEWEQLQ
jgi:RimJ/RimL family protein N-acetyltransferase